MDACCPLALLGHEEALTVPLSWSNVSKKGRITNSASAKPEAGPRGVFIFQYNNDIHLSHLYPPLQRRGKMRVLLRSQVADK